MARIFFDGLNLGLKQGTGIATYARQLTRVAHDLGHRVGILYNTAQSIPNESLLQEVAFFDALRMRKVSPVERTWTDVVDWLSCDLSVRPSQISLNGVVISREFQDNLPYQDDVFVARRLFDNAQRHFERTGCFASLKFAAPPDIFHSTFPMPLRCKAARNIYTIHDLVSLRLPFTSLDYKKTTYRMLKKIAKTADHIVTVSENSRKDIIELLDVPEDRITNTYQAVTIPGEYVSRPESVVAAQLEGWFGLDFGKFLLFFGALEPKKNVKRLIDAYFASGANIPLVLVVAPGWQSQFERDWIEAQRKNARGAHHPVKNSPQRVIALDYMDISMLVSLIKGACATVFPSLYEGFGLPVLEAMLLGTPIITSGLASFAELCGDAAVFVDPYNTDDIAAAITRVVNDADLRSELSRRGRRQAANFSVERYRERIRTLYTQ